MSDNIAVSLLGIDTSHQSDFVIDWPNGIHSYILMCFSTPFFIRTHSGLETGKPGDCILHTPNFAQYHGTPQNQNYGFRNDWLHMNGSGIMPLANQYDLPVNEIIHTGHPHIMTPDLRKIQEELSGNKPYKSEKISLCIDDMLLLISRHRQLNIEFENLKPIEQEYKNQFSEVRSYIQQHFQETWSVGRMADMLNLSTSRFSVLYQTFFKISPNEDLIVRRIEEAKILLLNTRSGIEQIAVDCGFKSIYYFSRIFKKRTGVSPEAFRNN
jgi:AraC-like DNA-binding protein